MKYPACYIYKRTSDRGRELRYSLRSLKNLTNWNGKVYIVGHAEEWLQNATVIDAPKFATRSDDVQSKYKTLAASKEIPDDFILMNDDFFILRKTSLTPLHHGLLSDIATKSTWLKTKHRTRQYLEDMGIKDPKDYDIHVPMLLNKEKLGEILKHHEGRTQVNHLMTRTLYGNIYKVGGKKVQDPKTLTNRLPRTTFASTKMFTFQLAEKFPDRSEFEV